VKAWLVLLGIVLSSVVPTHAHRLSVEWELADDTLEVRAFTETGPAAGADVELHDASGAVLAEGVLDDEGRFHWPLSGAGPITIEVNDGLGHRQIVTLTEEDLRAPPAQPGRQGSTAPPEAGSKSRTSGSSDAAFSQMARLGLGLTFLLALAAAWMSHRNTRRLIDLERRLERHEGRG
jgi:hypothetical protein